MKTNISKTLVLVLTALVISCEKEGDGQVVNQLPSLSISDVTKFEEDETVTFEIRVTLSGSNEGAVKVKYITSDGTAKATEDYVAIITETLSFSASETEKIISIEILGDTIVEGDEQFTITLNSPENANISKSTSTITIQNDDESISIIPETGYVSAESYPGLTKIWSDEFEDGSLNTSIWTPEIGTGNSGWGNNELQYYRAENTSIVEGNLVIEARNDGFGGSAYTSSRLITKDNFDFKYGRVDIRAVLPKGKGIWPALWMLGSKFETEGWPACGEIDIMELVGGTNSDKTVHGTIHWFENAYASYGGHYSLNSGIFADEFHVFSIIWDEQSIKWLVDDVQFVEADLTPQGLSEFHENFFFIFNVAVGGNWPGSPDNSTVFPQRMIVDYIRVFQ